MAWDQIYWTLGNNPVMATMVTGLGYNNPMPHSRFLGAFPGGFMAGFIGDSSDKPVLDLEGRAQWNTTEYWNTPLANCLMALTELWRTENCEIYSAEILATQPPPGARCIFIDDAFVTVPLM